MKHDRLFESGAVSEDFTFNDQVAEVFDDMLSRSIPFYAQVIDCMATILRQKAQQGTTVYDLGCATGTTLLELARRLPDLDLHFVGLDNAPAMLAKARRKAEMFSKSALVRFREDDITSAALPDGGVILCNYTLQFIRPLTRPQFVRHLYEVLPPGGLLLVSEKVISHDPMLNRVYIELYHQFKLRQGYSELEIAAKREALENILIPFSIDENRDLLTLAGFSSVETFFQWFNFASFIAVK
jgi:tRNA (cmo5U34)-methyltransferase